MGRKGVSFCTPLCFLGIRARSLLNGRPVGTRTPDLYRVKGQLTNTPNNLHNDRDRVSTPKYA